MQHINVKCYELCSYWRTNPTLIWGLFGWWATVGSAFGLAGGAPGLGSNINLLQALTNPRSDGLGKLYREGTASLLNSMASKEFPYTTKQVRDSFVAALSSNKAAAAQAARFKLANEVFVPFRRAISANSFGYGRKFLSFRWSTGLHNS
ncbi:hypothetical protein RND71_034794 [Anisodus tanguticus]|uniref:Uncharacterized protein n=1 Tax=Anisodus tanguticus TaxID=243964 RepID=A0AAE1UTW9_9SOLA|nr:hypothetical protein RND71_034794 [Anisodus tanguticus]